MCAHKSVLAMVTFVMKTWQFIFNLYYAITTINCLHFVIINHDYDHDDIYWALRIYSYWIMSTENQVLLQKINRWHLWTCIFYLFFTNQSLWSNFNVERLTFDTLHGYGVCCGVYLSPLCIITCVCVTCRYPCHLPNW